MEKIALSPRSQELIKNYLMGGAALGGSAALLTSLANYIKTLKYEKDEALDTSNDDDTLYVNAPAKKADVADMAAGGLALTGGVLSTLGSYALIRKLYQDMKKKQLQEQLDAAQQTFLGEAEQEAELNNKNAAQAQANTTPDGKPMGVGEFLGGAPVAFTLLSAIAAGALTNMALNKTFPRVKRDSNNVGPKKVVLRRPAPENTDEEVNEDEMIPEQEKYSSTHTDDDDGLEFLMGLVLGSKSASQSELADIVHAVGHGRHNEFTHNMLEYGFDTAMESIKGASDVLLSPTQKLTAIGQCVKSASLNPVVSLLAAAEYNDMAPRFTKIAGLQDITDKEILVKIANVLGALNRHEHFNTTTLPFVFIEHNSKEAAQAPLDIETILNLINQIKQQKEEGSGENDGEHEDVEEVEGINSEDSIDSSDEKGVNDLHPMKGNNGASPHIIDELDSDDDFIDRAMSAPVTPVKAVAAENK